MDNLEPFLTFDVKNDILAHMREADQNECCGLITLADDVYEYEPHKNIAKDPVKHFEFERKVSTRIARDKNVVAYVHSHPRGPINPSKHDIAIQASIKKPSVIVAKDLFNGTIEIRSFGDHLLDAPLDGRDFIYGIYDCLEAIRSEAWQREKRYMKPVPRIDGWWDINKADDLEEEDRDMYARNFEAYGYKEFTPDFDNPGNEFHPQVGDVLLMQVGSHVANHAAVYVGGNRIYHHRYGKRSGETPIGYVLGLGHVTKWVRYSEVVK